MRRSAHERMMDDMTAVVDALRQSSVFQALERLQAVYVDDVDPEEEITGRSREDITVVYHEPGDEDIALLLAGAFQSLKQISRMCVNAKGYLKAGGDAERAVDSIIREAESRMMTISSSKHTNPIKREDQHG